MEDGSWIVPGSNLLTYTKEESGKKGSNLLLGESHLEVFTQFQSRVLAPSQPECLLGMNFLVGENWWGVCKPRTREQFFLDKFSWPVRLARLYAPTSFLRYLKAHPRHCRFMRRNRSKPVKMAASRALTRTTLCDVTHALTGLVVQTVLVYHRVAGCACRSLATFPCWSVQTSKFPLVALVQKLVCQLFNIGP